MHSAKPPAPRAARPIFVIGSPRSGTSLLMEALHHRLGFRGFAEGQFVELLLKLLPVVERHYSDMAPLLTHPDHMISHVPQAQVHKELVGLFRRNIEKLLPGAGIWVDKTPGATMVAGATELRRIWPAARFIFAQRRGIENVASRLRKFPETSFAEHCQQWAECMQAWLRVRDDLKPRAIAIDQHELANSPRQVARRFGKFLGLDPAATAIVAECFESSTPQDTGGARAAPIALSETGWSPEQIQTYRQVCGKVARQFGYTEDGTYRQMPRVSLPAARAG